jgi:anti-sigma factor RsiW
MTHDSDIPTQAADLQAFFDGELDAAAAERMAKTVDRDPALRQHMDQMALMRDLVGRSLEMRAAQVPRARFEQIWDEIDRSISNDAKSPAAAPPSFWARVWAAFGPFRMPALAAAGAAAIAVVALNFGSPDPVNQDAGIASVPETAEPTPREVKPAPTPAPSPPAIAESFPSPRAADAEIHGVDFGGKQGRISHTGVVTVLYVEDDASAQKSERSL